MPNPLLLHLTCWVVFFFSVFAALESTFVHHVPVGYFKLSLSLLVYQDGMVANDAIVEEVHMTPDNSGLAYEEEDPFEVRGREGEYIIRSA